ncbi:MAG TPA: 2-hydroxychromene-2-carboxylate isomerase [Noviherbaspirillum sp.]
MATAIDFYFDFSSPYGYFAASRIEALAAKYGRTVHWHPVLLGAVFKTTGGQPLTQIPIKGDYARHDMQRTARLHAIPFRFPEKFPISSQLAARCALWAGNVHGEARKTELSLALYRAYFAHGQDITETQTVLAVAQELGLDGAAMIEAINGTAIKEQLREEVDAAMRRGVFGAPFMIVDGEPFWGFDRFDQIELWLKNGPF